MRNEFDNEFVEPADPNFELKIFEQLMPGRKQDDTNVFFLELVRGHPKHKPLWFILDKLNTNIETMQVIQVTVKRVK